MTEFHVGDSVKWRAGSGYIIGVVESMSAASEALKILRIRATEDHFNDGIDRVGRTFSYTYVPGYPTVELTLVENLAKQIRELTDA